MLFLVQPFVLQMHKPFYSNSLFQRQFWYKDFRHGKSHNKSTLILSKELISATKNEKQMVNICLNWEGKKRTWVQET